MAGHTRVRRGKRRNPAPNRPLLGLVESAWLFTRGRQSVRIIRVGPRHGGPLLVVQGPGSAHVIHEFDDVMACAIQQSEIERQLVAKRFKLHRFADRRKTDRRQQPVVPATPPTAS